MRSEPAADAPYRLAEVDYGPFDYDMIDDDGAGAIDRDYFLQVLRSYLKANDMSADWSSINSATNTFWSTRSP